MTVLLTGATGFIGKNVLTLLLEQGYTVVSYGRKTPDVSLLHQTRFKHVCGDLSSGSGLESLPWGKIEKVIHLAASGVKASRRAWPDAMAANVIGTQRLLNCISRASMVPTVFLARTFYEELTDQTPDLLENPYVATKRAATELGRVFQTNYSGTVVFGNLFQVYGVGDDPDNVLSYAARELKAKRIPTFSSGRSIRDWVYVTDAAAAVITCAHLRKSGDYDIGTSTTASVREMIENMIELHSIPVTPIFDPKKDRGDNHVTLAARNIPPNWQAKITQKKGIQLLYQNT